MGTQADYDAVIVGAGFAGLYALYHMRELGFSARVLEAGGGVGGTWYWNRYPGARCDLPSMEYSYQFSDELQQEWDWTERYAPQPEILAYAERVAEKFDLLDGIQFNTRVVAAAYDQESSAWRVETDSGEVLIARFCIMATGCLSAFNEPEFEGRDDFTGPVYHTGRWPREGVDFSGRRVAVIGTGSSGIQSIPLIAAQAAELIVFQRTPNYSVPARNTPMDPAYRRNVKDNYAEFRAKAAERPAAFDIQPNEISALAVDDETRRAMFEERWENGGFWFLGTFDDLGTDMRANTMAADFVREKIHGIVEDPQTADLLSPSAVFGCKRLCVDTNYYETFNLDHVSLVDVSTTPIERMTGQGIVVDGREYEVDAIVLATGFDAMTGALDRIGISGRDGRALKTSWSEGPKAYLGLCVAGFPNLFTVTGPGSPSVLANMITAIEQHVQLIGRCMIHVRDSGQRSIEAQPQAQEEWAAHVNEVASETFYITGCNSWYQGANIPGKPRVFMPYIGFPTYVEKCEAVVAAGYEGFTLR